MKKKRWITAFVVFLVVVGIGVGGKMYMENKKAKEIHEAEKLSVPVLKNTFEGIKSVEFKATDYNQMTGFYTMVVEMTDKKDQSVQFHFSYIIGEEEIGAYSVKDEDIQKEGQTTTTVHVIYSDKVEEEL